MTRVSVEIGETKEAERREVLQKGIKDASSRISVACSVVLCCTQFIQKVQQYTGSVEYSLPACSTYAELDVHSGQLNPKWAFLRPRWTHLAGRGNERFLYATARITAKAKERLHPRQRNSLFWVRRYASLELLPQLDYHVQYSIRSNIRLPVLRDPTFIVLQRTNCLVKRSIILHSQKPRSSATYHLYFITLCCCSH